jgi:hypothetical protein
MALASLPQKFIDDFTSNFSRAVRSADPDVILLHARGARPIDALIKHEWGHSSLGAVEMEEPASFKDKSLLEPGNALSRKIPVDADWY